MEKAIEKESGRRCLSIIFALVFSVPFLGHLLCAASFSAPVDFPQKEVTIVVPFGPGGSTDILGRGVGNVMKKYLGVPVVVMNMPGAGGARGRAYVYHSAPDGYTIAVNAADSIAQEILEKQDFENKKFSYIGNASYSPNLFCVKADSQIRSVKNLKSFGTRVRYGAFSLYTNSALSAMIMATRESWPMAIIGGYKSGGDAALGLIRGDFEFCGLPLSVASRFVKSGQIRPIMMIDQKRHPKFPDVPTVGEEGYPDLGIFGTSYWLMASPGVPKARIQTLEEALMKTLKDPEFLKWAEGADVDVSILSGEETRQMVLKIFTLLEQYKKEIVRYIEMK